MSHSGPGHVLPMSRAGPAHQGSAALANGPGGADLPCFAVVCSGGMSDHRGERSVLLAKTCFHKTCFLLEKHVFVVPLLYLGSFTTKTCFVVW